MTTTATTLPVATRRHLPPPEIAVAVAAFATLCLAVLLRSTQLLEPDDYAYRASIVALTNGHISLTNAQYTALTAQLGSIAQWVQLPNGSWISEKNPGYPFFAAPFQMLGLLRLAPLFYGTLGCFGLYAGGRRWLGRFGGMWAVVLYCSSGAALVFAWRATMPTFTDASLIAAGTGALVWTMLATDATIRRRTIVGLLAFLALEGAVAIRYTNVIVLLVALAAVALALRPAGMPLRALGWWLGSVALLVALLGAFDQHFYGGALKTGYSAGEITFGLSALRPNLEEMPSHLVRSMPFLLLGLVAVGWIAVRAAGSFRIGTDDAARKPPRRDAAVGGALAACWLGIFGLYAAYTWTVSQAANGGVSVHVIRFYLPALGAVALLAAWLLVRLPRVLAGTALITLVCLAATSYPGLASAGPGGPGGPGGADGRFRSGPPPTGRVPSGQIPGGRLPGGQPPTGQLPSGQLPAGPPPTGGAPPSGTQAPSASS